VNSDQTSTFMSVFLSSVQPPKQQQQQDQDKELQLQQYQDKEHQQPLLTQRDGKRKWASYDLTHSSNPYMAPKPTFITHPLQIQILQAACFLLKPAPDFRQMRA
jgi:hypothetical protein